MATFYEAHQLKAHHAKKVLRRKGIHGIGVGHLDPKNPKRGAAIIIYTDKNPRIKAAMTVHLSASIKGKPMKAPVRYVETGRFRPHVARFERRIRPVPGGFSVGQPSLSGTAGLIVINFPGRKQLFVCSNNHVLTRNNTSAFAVTLQPGGADGGTAPRDRIGRMDRFVRLTKGNNFMDAAIAIPDSNRLLNPRYATVGVIPGHLTSYPVGTIVTKVGRTSGRTFGRVQSVNATISVGPYPGLGTIRFVNQTVITGRNASLPGDSGSVWLRNSDKFAAAVNFAGNSSGTESISFPIERFMRVFRTRVALPSTGAGRMKNVKIPQSRRHEFVKPLTKQQMKSIKVIKGKRK